MTFLAKESSIKNKQAVFFALFFNSVFEERHYSQPSPKVNVESLFEFLHEDRDFDIVKNYKAAMFLLTQKEFIYNDLISQKDFEWFNDILIYNHPYEIRNGIFGLVQDETNFTFKFKKTNLKIEELKELITECLQSMIMDMIHIADHNFKYAYAQTLDKILKNSSNFKARE